MSRKLEEVTIQEFWDFYCKTFPPPPDCPPEDIDAVKNFYLSGLSAMLAFARRLEDEPDERRKAILAKLYVELAKFGHEGGMN